MSTKRDELVKEALCILLAAQFEGNLQPHPELGLWDDEIIAQFRQMVQNRIDELPGEYGKRLTEIAYQLEEDKQAIGSNRSIAHALAVEVAVQTINLQT